MRKTGSLTRPAVVSRIAYLALLFMAIATATFHLGAGTAQAASASLSWTPPSTHTDGTAMTNLAGYKLYTGTTSGNYSQNVDVGNVTSYSLSSLSDSTTYYFAVVAYDAAGDVSGYSNQATYTTPTPPPPTSLYTLAASAGSGGSITPSGSVVVSQGASQAFAISAGNGNKVAGVTVDGASVGAVSSYTFGNVAANHTIAATFSANVSSYSVTASAGTGGSISPAGTASVTSGASQTYTIAPASGYQVAGVTVDGASVGAVASYTFSNVSANHTIAATFSAAGVSGSPNIAHTGWTLAYVDSQELVAANRAATNAFDGNTGTMWTTQWDPTSPACPHEIQINLGSFYNLDSFSYLPPPANNPNGTIAKYEFYVSIDGVNWGTAVATGTFASDATLKQVSFAKKGGQYIRLRALSEINGNPWTSVSEINVTGTPAAAPANIPHTGWTLNYVDSQELVAANRAATNAFDGNAGTMWTTQWDPTSPACPHEIQINLGKSYSLNSFSYLPPPANNPNGTIAKYEFYVSSDGVNWGTAVATGTFASDATLKQVSFAPKSGQYIRLRALSEINGNPWTSVSEINVTGI